MAWTRRGILRSGAFGAIVGAAAPWPFSPFGSGRATAQIPEGGVRSHGTSLAGALKYGPDYAHFDYVNPSAPKAGRVRLDAPGRFDGFNPYLPSGQAASGSGLTIETLQMRSIDEPSSQYGLLSEWMEEPADHSWVAHRIREGARFQDGRPVTVDDVIWTFERLMADARPFFRFYYANVAEALDVGDNTVLFRFSESGNKELPHIIGDLPVLPAHFWADRDFSAPLDAPMLGSGPYRVSDFEFGRYVSYERIEEYWGDAIPSRVGYFNFQEVRFQYFFDRGVAFEAFKADDVDYWDENSSLRWATQYDFPAVEAGRVVREEPMLDGPDAVQTYAFNTRRERFADRRVRMAISMLYDFAFVNRAIFYNQYAQPISFFQGTEDLMARGLPDAAELALLEPFRDQLPAEVFEEPFTLPETDGSGQDQRRLLRRARRLLEEAGWTTDDAGVLRNADGEAFTLEFITRAAAQERVVRPLLDALERIGIQTELRVVDTAQYIRRLDTYDFDMAIHSVANSVSPGNEQRDFWGSSAADDARGRNMAGVRSEVVDSLIESIVFAEDREALAAASRAMDRVLLHGHYVILQLYTPFERIAYWNRFSAPETRPSHAVGFLSVWWYDAEKDAEL